MEDTLLGETQLGDASATGTSRRRTSAKLERGATVGRYVILDALGAGAMGMVYAAFDPDLDRRLAIKLLRPEPDRGASNASAGRDRLVREAQALARLQHPNVVTVHDVGEHEDQVYVAMELVDGVTLREWLESSPPREQILEVMLAAGRGLAAAHAKELVHRDFKPDNVMLELGDGGTVSRTLVLDFGLAAGMGERAESPASTSSLSSAEPRADLTRTGAVLGTPAYMSPEQHAGRRADAASDQFSFCVTLYEALYGARPFVGDNLAALAHDVLAGDIAPAPSSSRVPPWLRRIVVRGLSGKPADRYPSMTALLEELDTDPSRRRRRIVASLSALGLGAVAVAAFQWREHARETACREDAARIDESWNPATRQQVEDAVIGTELPFAGSTWQRLGPSLSSRADAWRADRFESCMDRSTLDPALREVQDQCFDEHLANFVQWLEILKAADGAVLNRVTWSHRRWTIDECTNPERLARREPLPADEDLRRRVRQLREADSRARLLGQAGRFKPALELAEATLADVRQLDRPALLVTAIATYASALERLERFDEAEAAYEEAFFAARRIGNEAAAGSAARQLTGIVSLSDSRFEEARQWGQHAEASLALTNADVITVAALQEAYAGLEFSAGNYETARDHAERALELYEANLESDSAASIDALRLLGTSHMRLGNVEESQAALQRALGITEHRFGPKHPKTADARNNLGAAYLELEAFEEAEREFRFAVELQRELGLDRKRVRTTTNLTIALRGQGRLTEARRVSGSALSLARGLYTAGERELASSLLNHGQVLEETGDLEAAITLYEEALTVYDKALGPEHVGTGDAVYTLARARFLHGDPKRAIQLARRAMEIYSRAYAPTHPRRMTGLQLVAGVGAEVGQCATVLDVIEPHIADIESATGSDHTRQVIVAGFAICVREIRGATEALPHARRAVALAASADVGKLNENVARFELGRTLWEAGEREEGGPMAQQAYAALLEIEQSAVDIGGLDRFREWLGKNPGVLPR